MPSVVVLRRVVCCYPDYERLLSAAASHARRLLVFSHPPNVLTRAVLSVRKTSYTSCVTAPSAPSCRPTAMILVAEAGGLAVGYRHRGLAWHIVEPERPAPALGEVATRSRPPGRRRARRLGVEIRRHGYVLHVTASLTKSPEAAKPPAFKEMGAQSESSLTVAISGRNEETSQSADVRAGYEDIQNTHRRVPRKRPAKMMLIHMMRTLPPVMTRMPKDLEADDVKVVACFAHPLKELKTEQLSCPDSSHRPLRR